MLPLLIGISHPSIQAQFGGERGMGGGAASETNGGGASYFNKHPMGVGGGMGAGKAPQMAQHKPGGGLPHFPPVMRD